MTALSRRAFVHAGACATAGLAGLALGLRPASSPDPRAPVLYPTLTPSGTWGFVRSEAAARGDLAAVDGVLGIRPRGRRSDSGAAP